ncbi:MAG: DUF1080 domain-containing protein [Gracilimonas sp.]
MLHISKVLLIIVVFISSCTPSQNDTSGAVNDTEFREILTENTLNEWSWNPEHWKFEDGILTGETTPNNIIIEHSFFVWDEGITKDFELKLEYKISPRGNSGINYRSERIQNKEFVLRGYQADLDGANEYTGQLYEDKGRAFLARRGQMTYIDPSNKVVESGSLGVEEELLSLINEEEWNSYHIIARDNILIHSINGRIMSVAVDDGSGSKKEGLLGFQLHLGPPMKVQFRDILFKKL